MPKKKLRATKAGGYKPGKSHNPFHGAAGRRAAGILMRQVSGKKSKKRLRLATEGKVPFPDEDKYPRLFEWITNADAP